MADKSVKAMKVAVCLNGLNDEELIVTVQFLTTSSGDSSPWIKSESFSLMNQRFQKSARFFFNFAAFAPFPLFTIGYLVLFSESKAR